MPIQNNRTEKEEEEEKQILTVTGSFLGDFPFEREPCPFGSSLFHFSNVAIQLFVRMPIVQALVFYFPHLRADHQFGHSPKLIIEFFLHSQFFYAQD